MADERQQTSGAESANDDPLAGDPELRRELAAMFLEDCPRLLREIHDAIVRRNGPDLKIAAHTIKGSSGVFKDQAAYDAALRMEHLGRDSNWAQVDDAWNVLNTEMARLSADLAALVGAAASPGNSSMRGSG